MKLSVTPTSDNQNESGPSWCLPVWLHEFGSKHPQLLTLRVRRSWSTAKQSHKQWLDDARGYSMDAHFVNNTTSVLRTTGRLALPFEPTQRSCSGLPLMLLPSTAPSTFLSITRFPSFLAALVDGRAIFTLVARRGTPLLIRQAPYDHF